MSLIFNAIQRLDYEYLIANENDEWRKQQLIEMYFDSVNMNEQLEKMNGRQLKQWRDNIFRRLEK